MYQTFNPTATASYATFQTEPFEPSFEPQRDDSFNSNAALESKKPHPLSKQTEENHECQSVGQDEKTSPDDQACCCRSSHVTKVEPDVNTKLAKRGELFTAQTAIKNSGVDRGGQKAARIPQTQPHATAGARGEIGQDETQFPDEVARTDDSEYATFVDPLVYEKANQQRKRAC